MVKSGGLSWIALKHQKILAVKVQYNHCSKLDNFRPEPDFLVIGRELERKLFPSSQNAT
jgi:hypothetical protein